MRGKRKWVSILFGLGLLMNISLTEASVIFNEIFADPPSDLSGDANNDGTRSGTQDEFLELFNKSLGVSDISGWSIADSVSVRHIFPSDTVMDPNTFLVIFGGGDPGLPEIHWQVASSGTLGLNNASDTVTLFNSEGGVVDQVNYGNIADHDQSITLSPDGFGEEFVLHSGLEQSQGALFSPGTSADLRLSLAVTEEEELPNNPVVPEFPTLMYLLFGWGSILLKRRGIKHVIFKR
jgi:hypothetical protein